MPLTQIVGGFERKNSRVTIALSNLPKVGHICFSEIINGGKDGTLWYFRTLAKTFREINPSPLTDELGRVVSELEQLVREADGAQ